MNFSCKKFAIFGSVKKTLTIVVLLITIAAHSQQCNCDSNFIWLKAYLERNYPGFKTKVTPATKQAYIENTKEYEMLIKQSNKPAYCEYFMLKWLSFFKDHHIQIAYDQGKKLTKNQEKDTAIINQLTKGDEFIDVDSVALAKKFTSRKERSIEGIYLSTDSTYYIAIIKNKNVFRNYVAVILSSKTKLWKKGEVKQEIRQVTDSTFDAIVYLRNHSIMIYSEPYVLQKNGNAEVFNYTRIIPAEVPEKVNPNTNGWVGDHDASYRNLDDMISYLRINSFEDEYRHEIDSVVNANAKQIKSHKYMIIDLRGNGGGSDGSFQSLLPIVYSNPVINTGVDLYCTPDNIAAIKKLMQEDQYLSEGDRHYFDSVIKVMRLHPYQFVNADNDDTTRFDSVWHFPEKIVILMNRYCASTTEQFLLFAKQCKKVVLMGEHTEGELDYSNIRPVDFPCTLPGTFYYPTTQSRRIAKHQGIDGIGIIPEIKLDVNTDWIKAAQEYLLRK